MNVDVEKEAMSHCGIKYEDIAVSRQKPCWLGVLMISDDGAAILTYRRGGEYSKKAFKNCSQGPGDRKRCKLYETKCVDVEMRLCY